MEENKPSRSWKEFLRDRFDLNEDKASEDEVKENIRKGVEFRGTNLWVLIFATSQRGFRPNMQSQKAPALP